ncbi:hypothetical protein L1281_002109 [Neisseria sp. HSC-16F19]|nr:hemagglutinin repeat-containing protein [Neisseria sp. HSC-16F19]MCP2041507.1 hypothetical protein [Neisseria sp. HSC-16F19]
MNRHCHRIIYNARRGQWMVVAEHTRRSGKQAGEGRSVSGSRHPLRLLSFSLWCAFGLTLIFPAQAQILLDGRPQALQGSGALLKAEAGIGFKTANSSQSLQQSLAQGNTLQAGGNIGLHSRSEGIRLEHTQARAGQALHLDSAADILLGAAADHTQAQSKNSHAGASVGVGVSVGAQTGIYAYVEAGGGKGRSKLEETRHRDTVLSAREVRLHSRKDTVLKGAQVYGNSIGADIGGTLHIESLQDSRQQSIRQSQGGIRVQVSFGTAWEASGHYSGQQGDSSLVSVKHQSGLYAGDQGYRIRAGQVMLKGGAIAASAPAEDNLLATRSIHSQDLRNHSSHSASSVGISGSYGGQLSGSQTFKNSALGQAFARGGQSFSQGLSYSPGLPQQQRLMKKCA